MDASWQWQSASGWQEYSMELSAQLEAAHQAGQVEVHCKLGQQQEGHVINLAAQCQLNQKTQRHKIIRRQSSLEEASRWEFWQASVDGFQPFAQSISVELERAFNEGRSEIQVELGATHIPHEMQLDRMVMVSSGHASSTSNIRRMVENKSQLGRPRDIVWEYEDETGFKPYGRVESDCIEEGHQQSMDCVRIQIGSAHYDIRLSHMQQQKCSTGFVRSIRRMMNSAVVTSTGDSGSPASPVAARALWEWGEYGVFTPYEPDKASLLEAAWQQGKHTLPLMLGWQEYRIVFGSMEQQNIATGFSRPIRRTVGIIRLLHYTSPTLHFSYIALSVHSLRCSHHLSFACFFGMHSGGSGG
jgi:peptide methionine sulfoxide reductase MsrB